MCCRCSLFVVFRLLLLCLLLFVCCRCVPFVVCGLLFIVVGWCLFVVDVCCSLMLSVALVCCCLLFA